MLFSFSTFSVVDSCPFNATEDSSHVKLSDSGPSTFNSYYYEQLQDPGDRVKELEMNRSSKCRLKRMIRVNFSTTRKKASLTSQNSVTEVTNLLLTTHCVVGGIRH